MRTFYRELYERCVETVRAGLAPMLAPMGSSAPGFRLVKRNRPTFEPAPDLYLPAVVVAHAAGFGEQVVRLTFDRHAVIDYPVWVGAAVDYQGPADDDNVWRIDEVRELVRELLWDPGSLQMGRGSQEHHDQGEFDVAYDPAGTGGEPPPPNTRGAWQLFTFRASRSRGIHGSGGF